MTIPLRAAMNGYGAARDQGQGVVQSFDDAVFRAAGKFAAPFVEESIATQFILDVTARGGQTSTGRRLWNPQDDLGTKVTNTLTELFRTASPGSLAQFRRLYLSGFGNKDQYNRGYKFLNESSGLLGFRIQNPFIEDGINFKISDNKRAVADSKKLFTSVAYRADSTPEEIVAAYRKANEAKLRNDQTLFKQIQAARQLGVSDRKIKSIIGERYSANESRKLLRNQFTPIKVSDFAFQTMRKNSIERDGRDISRIVRAQTNGIYRSLGNSTLFDDPRGLFKETINVIEGTPLTTRPKVSDASPILDFSQTQTPVLPNITGAPTVDRFGNTSTIAPSDRSQLAKSGDIDITEAIANRG